MIGASGTYAVNGTDLTLKPTQGRWLDRDILGYDGGGHPIYPAVRSFEMSWNFINASDLSQIIGFFNQVQNTGTVAVDLPLWNGNPYQFNRYSGCVLEEPTVGAFFEGYISEVKLLVHNIT